MVASVDLGESHRNSVEVTLPRIPAGYFLRAVFMVTVTEPNPNADQLPSMPAR
jgi:hypothetical protein